MHPQSQTTPARPIQVDAVPPGPRPAVGGISVIVPTYKEAPNIEALVLAIERVRESSLPGLDLWIMDDKSRDGSVEAAQRLDRPWVRLIEREGERGLSAAVLDGFSRCGSETLLVMDADLSHPPDAIPRLLAPLDAGYELVIGSRYVPGGSTDTSWGFKRWAISRGARLMAWPLARLTDPLAGFFAIRRSTLERATRLDPVGFKIALEIIVRCRITRIAEVPIHFADRTRGTSKLSARESLRYIEHLRRLYLLRLKGDRALAARPARKKR